MAWHGQGSAARGVRHDGPEGSDAGHRSGPRLRQGRRGWSRSVRTPQDLRGSSADPTRGNTWAIGVAEQTTTMSPEAWQPQVTEPEVGSRSDAGADAEHRERRESG